MLLSTHSPGRQSHLQQRILVALATAIVVAATAVPAVAARKAQTAASGYERRDDVRAFIDELVRDHGFSRATLRRWFSDARYQPKIVAAMQRPLLEPPKWYEYAPQFLSASRIGDGVAFWRAHEAALDRASDRVRRPAGNHRRDHRRGDVLRPQHRAATGSSTR